MKLFHYKRKGVGLPPGTMIYAGEKQVDKVTISAMSYNKSGVEKFDINFDDGFIRPVSEEKLIWINTIGLHDVKLLDEIGKAYNIHPLVLEDILNTDQRPKIEFFDDYIFISMKFISYPDDADQMIFEQISLIVGEDFLLSFQEYPEDPFGPVRERIENGKGKIRTRKTDYLMYALLDVLVDHYYTILEKIGTRLELIDMDVVENPTQDKMNMIQLSKKELILFRRSVWPLREMTSNLSKEEHELIHASSEPFIRDLYDHVVQVVDTVESYRDITSGLLDLYLSGLSQKMNEVMKVLTIIATIFIPTTFLAGIYGMNFEFMPELGWKYSYGIFWTVIITMFGGMLYFFRKKNWL